MKVLVLKPFPYAHDGYTVRDLSPSDRDPPDAVEIRDDLIAGLEAAGYISTGQGVGHVLQAAADQAAVDGPDADDRAGPVEGLPEAGARAAGAEVSDTVKDWNDPSFVVAGLSALIANLENAAEPVTEIPADWKSKHWKQRVALAKTLGWVDGEPTTEQADGWIADVIEHRRREEPQEALGGLSIREAHDKLTKAGAEWEAGATVQDLAELLAIAEA